MRRSATIPHGRHSCDGFSLLEAVTTIAVLLIAAAIAVMSIGPAVRTSHVDNAYELTLGQLRLARQTAIDKRTVCIVAFAAAGQISSTQAFADGTPVLTTTLQLPQDVSFLAITGIPNTSNMTPDGLGQGNRSIDFDQVAGGGGTAIYFQPDGSAQDAVGRVNDGVIYIAQPGALMSSRAVTLLGTTGRIRGWRLIGAPGKVAWQ
jgi:type II secretory pathway pseudopilin PulG